MRRVVSLLAEVISGLRFRLLFLVFLTCAPLVALTLNRAWEDRRQAVTNWEQRSQRMTQLATREEEKLIGETKQLLLAMAESTPVRTVNRRGCKKLVDELFASYPRYANLGVISTNAEVIASAVGSISATDLTEQPFFRRAMEMRAFAIDDLPVGLASDHPTVSFGCPIIDRMGVLQGVVFATLDLSWLNRFGSELSTQLPREATWTELDRNGTIVVRYPAVREWNGQPFPEKSLLKTVLSGTRGVAEAVDVQGVPTFYAYAPMHSRLVRANVVTILGIPKQALFAGADRALFRDLGWSGLAAAIALLLGWLGSNLLVLRPVNTLVRSSARLASGDLTARTGLPHGKDELGRLTLAFDLMAQALEQRELERKRASHKLQIVSHRLVEVQETERRQIARELHDEIGQSLTVAEMNLNAALQQTPAKASLTRRLEDSVKAVERVLEQVHDLSLNLRPSMLDDLGLEPALRWYTNRQATLAGLQAHFRADPLEHRMDPMIETECFRIGQEALTNVVRHAQAGELSVELRKVDGQLHLSVRDDGVGFDVTSVRDKAVRGASLGVLSMEERAALAGGGLEFISAPGKGTEVHAWFPLKWQNAEPESALSEAIG
jgi:signal transduction histidine kinase